MRPSVTARATLYLCVEKFVKACAYLIFDCLLLIIHCSYPYSEAKHRCDFFLDIFDISWPDSDLDCDTLPDSPDPDICVGNQETLELNQLANRHSE